MSDAETEDVVGRQIDAAVTEIFRVMLRRDCTVADLPAPCGEGIAATIVFSGTLNGECIICTSLATAGRLTAALLGSEAEWGDAMIEDAVGELCNMIAGGWKSKLASTASICGLSIPSISRGLPRGYWTEGTRIKRTYSFEGHLFQVGLALE